MRLFTFPYGKRDKMPENVFTPNGFWDCQAANAISKFNTMFAGSVTNRSIVAIPFNIWMRIALNNAFKTCCMSADHSYVFQWLKLNQEFTAQFFAVNICWNRNKLRVFLFSIPSNTNDLPLRISVDILVISLGRVMHR